FAHGRDEQGAAPWGECRPFLSKGASSREGEHKKSESRNDPAHESPRFAEALVCAFGGILSEALSRGRQDKLCAHPVRSAVGKHQTPAMSISYRLRDRKSKTSAAIVVGPRGVRTEKRLRHAREKIGRKTRSII